MRDILHLSIIIAMIALLASCVAFQERPDWTCREWGGGTCVCERADARGAFAAAVVVRCGHVPKRYGGGKD